LHQFRKMKKFIFTLWASLCAFTTLNAQTSINIARQQAIGCEVTISGIITNGAELGTIRYIQDLTGGIGIYSTNFASSMNRGDSVIVTGTLYDFNNLLEISPVSNVTVINNSNILPTPQIVTPGQLGEDLEGELIRLDNITFTNGGSTFAGNTSYQFTSGNESSTIYVRNGSPLIGQVIPVGSISMVGICSQFNADYQVLPRDGFDLIDEALIHITSSISTTGITNYGFTLNWTTDIEGTTEVNYGLTPDLELGTMTNSSLNINHSFPLFGVNAGEIYYCQVFSVAGSDTAFAPIRPFGVASNSSGDIKVYFNSSVDTTYNTGQNAQLLYYAIDDTLIAYINRAELTLDMTIYDFNNDSLSNISEAINAAYDRGVVVRFISDGSLASTNSGVTDLYPAIQRIESPTTAEYNIMHNKFVIIDANHSDPMKPIVWTGATNWTDRQINRDNNNVIIIQDQTLARAYTLEFQEMWGSEGPLANLTNSKFGSFKTDNTPHEFNIAGKRMECYFSPSDNTNSFLLNTINSANSSLHFCSMLITRADLAEAINTQHANGLSVNGVIDDATSTTQYDLLLAELGAENLIVNQDTNIIMHHKYLIVDETNLQSDPILWTGSHNWSNNANTKNDENTLVVHDPVIVNLFYQEFMARLNQWPTLDPDTDTTTVDTTIFVQNFDLVKEKFMIYPNPAKQNGSLNFKTDIIGQYDLYIDDASLHRVMAKRFYGNGEEIKSLPLGDLPRGIYFIKLVQDDICRNGRFVVY
jgi:phosphatidylserine/phosphatidylglycerophosphate/cardiolipin synthase-like enzyme